MRGLRSDNNLANHGLKMQVLNPNKKSRSLSSNEFGKEETAKNDELVKSHIQVFPFAPKDDNESIETLSEEGERHEVIDQCKSEVKKLDEPNIIFPQIIITLNEDEGSKVNSMEVPKRRRLFEDFNEISEKRRKEIEERKMMQQEKERSIEEAIEKLHNSLQREPKIYTKSIFFVKENTSSLTNEWTV